MELYNLKPAAGATKSGKRIARGQGSGHGGTATRGHKGAKSRSGYSKKIGFEGGQMPLQRRIPKFGFKNINRVEYKAVNLGLIEKVATKLSVTEIDKDVLVKAGICSKNDRIKVLSDGEFSTKLSVKASAFSQKAVELIEAQGGTAEKI